MSEMKTLTIALKGDVPLRQFSSAMDGFCELIYSLTDELAPGAEIRWVIERLEAGSAEATIAGISDDAKSLGRIVAAYAEVGNALSKRTIIPYSTRVANAAKKVANVINGSITSVVFIPEDEQEIHISGQYSEGVDEPSLSQAIGTLKGRVDTLTRRRHLGFTLYDSIFDRPITCYLEPGHEDDVREYWGKKVFVSGIISRDTNSGRPVSIRKISQIRPVESSAPGSYRKARGVIRLDPGETSEGLIRKVRDEQ